MTPLESNLQADWVLDLFIALVLSTFGRECGEERASLTGFGNCGEDGLDTGDIRTHRAGIICMTRGLFVVHQESKCFLLRLLVSNF